MAAVVDLRTRRDGAEPPVDVVDLLARELPALLGRRAALVPPPDELRLRPWILRLDTSTWRLDRDDAGSFRVERRDDPARDDPAREGERVVESRLTDGQFADLVADQVTPIGLMTAGTLDLAQGRIGHLLDWWLVLRAVLDDRPVYRPGSVDIGVDLARSFTLDDDPDEIASFLAEAGFLHLRGVFTPEEMATVSDDMDLAAPTFDPDDGDGWWATLADGSRQIVRMHRFDRYSPTTARLLDDPRFLRIAEIVGAGHAIDPSAENRIEALFKPLGVVSGISDIPWHKDCSLGRHSYECCSLTVGISVTGGGPTSGQLRVLAGSHRALVWPSLLDTAATGLPEVALPTETGDVTVHLSCTLHMAEPPTERPRRVMYTGLRLPVAPDDEARQAAHRRLLATSREGAPRNASQPSSV